MELVERATILLLGEATISNNHTVVMVVRQYSNKSVSVSVIMCLMYYSLILLASQIAQAAHPYLYSYY